MGSSHDTNAASGGILALQCTLRRTRMTILLLVVFWFSLLQATASGTVVRTLTIGVLDNRHNATATNFLWQPTFDTYVNHHLHRLGADFTLKTVALPFENLTSAVRSKTVDFVFSNTGHITILGVDHDVVPVASIEKLRLGTAQVVSGGAAFTWNNSGVSSLQDCGLPQHRDKVAAVSALSFGGYASQLGELANAGVGIDPIIESVTFTGSHEESLRLCNDRKKRCCFVRTDKFESNAIDRPHLVHNLVHLSPKTGLEFSFFPFKISTQLYPEWIVAAQPHVSQEQREILSVILFATKRTDQHAVHAHYTRWIAAADLTKARECLYDAKVLVRKTEAPRILAPAPSDHTTATLIIVTTTLVGVLALATMGVMLTISIRNKQAVQHAPKEGPFAMLITDIESSTWLWETFGSDMAEAVDLHHDVIRRCIHDNNCYEVKVIGDCFVIAAKSLVDAATCALSIQQKLMDAPWPASIKQSRKEKKSAFVDEMVTAPTVVTESPPMTPPLSADLPPPIGAKKEFLSSSSTSTTSPCLWRGLSVRMGLHLCTEVEPKFDMVHGRYDYVGFDINLANRVQAVASGGQILMTEDTHLALHDNTADFEDFIAPNASLYKFCSGYELDDGVNEPMYSMVPQNLAARRFQKIDGTLDETASGSSRSTRSESSSASSLAFPSHLLLHHHHDHHQNNRLETLVFLRHLFSLPATQKERDNFLYTFLKNGHSITRDGEKENEVAIDKRKFNRMTVERRLATLARLLREKQAASQQQSAVVSLEASATTDEFGDEVNETAVDQA